jgi:hypothetical protein
MVIADWGDLRRRRSGSHHDANEREREAIHLVLESGGSTMKQLASPCGETGESVLFDPGSHGKVAGGQWVRPISLHSE